MVQQEAIELLEKLLQKAVNQQGDVLNRSQSQERKTGSKASELRLAGNPLHWNWTSDSRSSSGYVWVYVRICVCEVTSSTDKPLCLVAQEYAITVYSSLTLKHIYLLSCGSLLLFYTLSVLNKSILNDFFL